MIRELRIGTIALPKILVCDTQEEAEQCKQMFVPWVLKPKGMSEKTFAKAVLYSYLKRTYPYIKWSKLGFNGRKANNIDVCIPKTMQVFDTWRENNGDLSGCGNLSESMSVNDGGYRLTAGDSETEMEPCDSDPERMMKVDKFITRTTGWHVDVEQLQDLNMLPVFLDDIATAIKKNIGATYWMDGWNKKLEAPLGYFDTSSQAPNLIVLDTSGSIPAGISFTMHALIDTLRTQADADLILTSRASKLIKAGEPLPEQWEMNRLVGGCNECIQFYRILKEHVLGKHWGNVIVFGDQDAPDDHRFHDHQDDKPLADQLAQTKIDRLMAFHTYRREVPGYGRWAEEAGPKEIVYNNSWADWMD